jgi:hypothetical protein
MCKISISIICCINCQSIFNWVLKINVMLYLWIGGCCGGLDSIMVSVMIQLWFNRDYIMGWIKPKKNISHIIYISSCSK